jgi:hypothetical protein
VGGTLAHPGNRSGNAGDARHPVQGFATT